MVHSILARKCKEKKDMENEIKALTEELKALKVKEAEAEKRLAELRAANIEKAAAERDGGIKLNSSKNKSFITAQSARTSSETSYAFKNHIAKCIIEEAKEGRTKLYYSTWGICDVQLNAAIQELASLGYEVDLDGENEELIIKW